MIETITEADALLADICEYGPVTITTGRGCFIAVMYGGAINDVPLPQYAGQGATLVGCLRKLYDQVVAE